MFFALSKLLWIVVAPGNLFLLFLCLGGVLLWTRWRRAGQRMVIGVAVGGLAVAILPLGPWLLVPLENRFPMVKEPPKHVDGIIVLGGMVDQFVTRARGQVALGGAVERLTEFAVLSRRYPKAKLVFTGGSGSLFHQDVKEADVLRPTFRDVLGIDMGRLMLENQSRNTYENAALTYKLIRPQPGQTWILITSASHMPRAVGAFRKSGWRVVPYPVDFNFRGDERLDLSFDFASGLRGLDAGLHEWAGLIFYWLTGRTDTIFPAPRG